tara:strand:- start:1974 stop:3710 length:1737 start_codon:yes stop_codon:yes gene_type:complete
MLTLFGVGVGFRVAIGKAVVLDPVRPKFPKYKIAKNQIENESNRFQLALETVSAKLDTVQKTISDESLDDAKSFIEVHRLILEDPIISKQPIELIKKNFVNAEWALQTQIERLTKHFLRIEDTYLRGKKDDIQQIIDHILKELATNNRPQLTVEPSNFSGGVVVTNDLMPADLVMLHNHDITAFITGLGGPISHTSILTKSLGIPAVVGLHETVTFIRNDDVLAVDGYNGIVLVNPDQSLVEEFQERQRQQIQREKYLISLKKEPSETLDGKVINLLGNIEVPLDVEELKNVGGSDVGLYRTEFLYMNRIDLPDESEQYQTYKNVLSSIAGTVTIRTLDLGADKQVDGGRPNEGAKVNPALGRRAIRLCLNEPTLFKPHLRAIMRASVHGSCRLMIPMLSSLSELDQTLRIIEEIKEDLKREGLDFDPNVPIGAMIEVPAAAISADLFAMNLDFLSIGTNDLIQYTLAIDRIDDEVDYLYDPLHPSVLRLIDRVIRAGKQAGTPVAMCGEMAGDPDYTRLLLGLGLVEFSMVPKRIPEIKEVVRKSKRAPLMLEVPRILNCTTPLEARSFIEELNAES